VQESHAWREDSVVFDEGNLVSQAGLVPLLELAERTGLSRLLDEHVRFVDERVRSGTTHATPKLTSIIAGMAAGADSIDDLDVIRSGGMSKVFGGVYAASTLGIPLREFTHGHTRQLAGVLRWHLVALAARTPVLAGIETRAFNAAPNGTIKADATTRSAVERRMAIRGCERITHDRGAPSGGPAR
jgi:hypothetical protein